MTPVDARPAASLLTARDSADGPQLFMVRRHPRSQFMANALVFVGGRMDPADAEPRVLARCRGLTPERAAARLELPEPVAMGHYVAALRECFEEAGLLLADGRLPASLQPLRDSLNRGEQSFAELLEPYDLHLPLDRLRYLDHWITPEFEHKRYDARFFVCRAPEGQEAAHDPKETTYGAWLTVAEILAGNRAGELHLAPPTLVILEGLQGCASVKQMLARAPDAPVAPTMPRPLMQRAARPTLLLPGDHRYDGAPEAADAPVNCVELVDGTWRHVRREMS